MEPFASQIWNIPPPFNMIVVIVALSVAAGVISTVVKQIRLFADHQADRQLKIDLVERGVTPEEAERWAQIETKSKRK